MSLLSGKAEEDVMAEINITPFTDVLLVLLIIFMILAALVTPPGFEKELANQKGQPSRSQPHVKKIQVLVNDRGAIYVDGQKTDTSAIYALMLRDRAAYGNRQVDVVGDVKTPYGVIIRVLDACKIAGLTDVQFVSE